MKNWLPFIFIFFSISIYCQNKDSISSKVKSKETRFEFMMVPLILFNRVDIGIGKVYKKFEHTLYASSYFMTYFPVVNVQLSYNLNYYLKNQKSYIPLWFKASNSRRSVYYEEGYFPHTLRLSIGSGFGRTFRLSKRFLIRSEIGAGVSLNLTNSQGNIFPFNTNFSDYKIDQYYPKQNPPILPAFRLKLNFIYSKK